MNVLSLMGRNPLLILLTSFASMPKKKHVAVQPKTKSITNSNPNPQETNNLIYAHISSKISVDKLPLPMKENPNDKHDKSYLKNKSTNNANINKKKEKNSFKIHSNNKYDNDDDDDD